MSFIDEIFEQPVVARRLTDCLVQTHQDTIANIQKLCDRVQPTQFIFVGMGSSLFASEITCTFLRRRGIRAFALEANEFLGFDGPIVDEHTILVAVSQSGNSMETVRFCEKYKNHPMITVTNQEQGNLAKYGDVRLFLKAGDEHFTATKSYTNTVIMLVFLAYALAKETDKIDVLFDEMYKCADGIESILAEKNLPAQMDDFIGHCTTLSLVGSGASYATAQHGLLVLMEAARMSPLAFTSGQFIHGPVEIIDEDFGCILFDFDPVVREEVNGVIDLIDKFGGRSLIFTNRTDLDSTKNRLVRTFDCQNPFLSSTLEIMPVELLTYAIGQRKGTNPGVLHRVHK